MIYNFVLLFLITILTIIIILLSFLFTKHKVERLYIVLMILSIYIYSGVGISIEIVNDNYIIKYLTLQISIATTMGFIFMLFKKVKKNPSKRKSYNALNLDKFSKILNLVTIIFYFTYLVYLLVPEFRLFEVLNPPLPSLSQIFSKRLLYNSISIITFFDTLNILIKPLFLINLYRLITNNKIKKLLILYLLWVYLDYLKFGYLGRNEILTYFIFISLIFIVARPNLGFKIKKKTIFLIAFTFAIFIPLFFAYEDYRISGVFKLDSFYHSMINLFQSETYYPVYYEQIAWSTSIIRGVDYLKWLLFLPIPTFFWASKFSININSIFTKLITGKSIGDAAYTVVLPSFMGESILVWGNQVYFFHGVLIAMLISFLVLFYNRYKSFTLINLYFLSQIIFIGRAGSQFFLSSVINSSLLIFLLVLLYSLFYKNISNLRRNL